jgi:leucyl aminopeptidase
MNYHFNPKTIESWKTDCLILPIWDTDEPHAAVTLVDTHLNGIVANLQKSGDISGKSGHTLLLPLEDKQIKRVLFVGAGKPEKFNAAELKKLVQTAAGVLKNGTSKKILFCLDSLPNLQPEDSLQLAALAMDESGYRFQQFKSEPAPKTKLTDVEFHIATPEISKAAAKQSLTTATAIGKGVEFAKDLGNLPGNVCTPSYLASQAKKLAEKYKELKVDVLDEAQMKKLGMGALLSVSKGSIEPAKLIVIEYKGADKKAGNHMLVGKGITFDSGGISLKPGAQMDEMKYDMCGAASVLGTVTALCELKAEINLVAIVASAENMPGGKATKPGDIVTTMSGKTVEILNTDAEGRLVLCDALSYARKYNPVSIVDIATLTGACIVALGNDVSGMLANNDDIAKELLEAGQQINDKAWQLPLFDEYQPLLDSNFADIQNIGARPVAGTITAACFLSRFTEGLNWAHLDVAGTAWVSGKDKGATGRPVPLLTRYLLNKISA